MLLLKSVLCIFLMKQWIIILNEVTGFEIPTILNLNNTNQCSAPRPDSLKLQTLEINFNSLSSPQYWESESANQRPVSLSHDHSQPIRELEKRAGIASSHRFFQEIQQIFCLKILNYRDAMTFYRETWISFSLKYSEINFTFFILFALTLL